MKRRLLTPLLAISILLTGCQSWNVNAFGVPTHGSASYARAPAPRPMPLVTSEEPMHAIGSGLSTEEKWGVVLIIGVAVAAGIIFAANS